MPFDAVWRQKEPGLDVIKAFDSDAELKSRLGIQDVTFDVPRVLMTKPRA